MRSEKKYVPPLFETKRARGLVFFRSFAVTLFVGICLILFYRVSNIPRDGEEGRWVWIGLLGAELWFGFYWVLTQALRWNQVHRLTFKDRLSQRYEKDLPRVDIFVCTADPVIEPPVMVMNTVLSVMAYDYPPEKLAIYLSDDAGSVLTFYALLEASRFAKQWLPYCKKFDGQPRSPAAYFVSKSPTGDGGGQSQTMDFTAIKNLYQEMADRIETATMLGRIPEEARLEHEGFSQWDSYSSKRDHDTILKILIDGEDPCSTDTDGSALPTLVYLAREKRPQHFHNFKAGAMNALIRVSSKISNGQIVLNLDCDMYSNDPLTVRDALCFFMDEEKSHDIAFVQFPQWFANVTKNDLYSSSLRVITNVEFHGTDGYGGPLYVGTGCFHRRDILCGREFSQDSKIEWKKHDDHRRQQSVHELEEETKTLASCTHEQNTKWGDEMGLKYGCPVEDVITGLSIQCKGWKSAYFNPERKAFLGLAPTTLPQVLVQHKRWSEGDFQILLSKYSPAWFAHGRISLGLQLGYCCYCFWAPNCLATLYYSIVPSLFLLKGISLFPQVSSPWFLPFAYVIFAKYIYSLVEFLWAGGTVLGWWNDQRIWLYKRTSSYLFATIDTVLKTLGFGDTAFVITDKVADEDVSQRYEKEMMEFGATSPMFEVLSTLAMLNLFCLVGAVKKVIVNDSIHRLHETMPLQILLCGVLVLVNLPLYQGLLLRKDRGRMPCSVTVKSSLVALLVCTTFSFL
uniref:Cellulose synthase-like protein E1 n=1 Tax=Populus tomentosa TaxID=118781 RepID=A0A1L6K444_POPTO|nr:cellulose synthase-like protein E1 [Populus tomentosa]